MNSSHSFDVSRARGLVQDLFQPRPWIYWSDFLVSLTIGYGCAVAYLDMQGLTLVRIGCFVMAGLALFRVSSFMHEIVHFRKNELVGFRIAWNLLAGVPMLTPSFLYESHLGHHNTNDYGTANDGEYLPLANGPLRDIAYFLGQVFVQPIAVVLRFTLLTPISFLHSGLRQWTLEHASSFVINWRHRRKIPDNAPRLQWAVMDMICSLRAMAIFAAVGFGATHWTRVLLLYSIAVFILSLNHLRTLVAHRYRSDGRKRSHVEQLFDSVDVIGTPLLTELWSPVGLRYHALHHLFPSIPYHNLGIAHRRLMQHLPADSPYRSVVQPSYRSAVRQLLADVRHQRRHEDSLEARKAA
jgi:fatty acid desaturase